MLPRETRRNYVNLQYSAWARNNTPHASDLRRMRREAENFSYSPLISVVMPVYEPKEEWLRWALDSVLGQVYPHWELCICDDSSESEHVGSVLGLYGRLDERIKVRRLEHNRGISAASNAALEIASGEFFALLDHDDELPAEAFFEVAKLLQEHPEADLVYSDVDKLNAEGNRIGPNFKPGWSPDLLLSSNYISHLGVFRKSISDEIGGFRSAFDGCQDYDLTLRFTEQTNSVFHVPKVLYHWRMVEGSVALSSANKSYIRETAHKALLEALERRGIRGTVEDGLLPNRFRVRPEITGAPLVSVIVPTRDNPARLKACIESIERRTAYESYEILIVDNGSKEPETVEYLAATPHNVIPFEGEFNFSKVNNLAANHAAGEYLLFLNDDTEVISTDWMQALLEPAQRREIGAVGARLLYPDGRIQHAGVLTGAGHPWVPPVATHSHQQYPSSEAGYAGTASAIRNYSAVTAACMLVRHSVFKELGGFDEALRVAYNDVDLCLRLRERGYLIAYTPHASLYHHESASRGYGTSTDEALLMRRRWGETLDNDPYYNPNFATADGDFELRADLLRPRTLRRPSSSLTAQDPRLMEGEDFRAYLHTCQEEARDSSRHSLLPGS